MNVGNTDDRWKERFCLPRVAWSTFARNKKERGIVGRTSHDGVRQIYNWNPESGISEQITFTRSGASQAVISPDGRFVYFLSDDQGNEVGEIVRVPYTGGEEETVTPGLSEYSLVGHPSFSGDGRFLGFTYGADDEFNTCLVDLRSPDFSRRVIRTSTHLITMPILSEDGKVTVFGMTERRRDRLDLEAYDTDRGHSLGHLVGTERGSRGFHSFCPIQGRQVMLGLQEEGEYAKPFLWDTRTLDVDDSIGAELEGDVTPLDWSSDAEALLVARYWGGEEQLHLYSIEDRQMRSIGHKPGSFSFTGRGGSYLKNDRVFVTYQNFAQNSKVVSIDGSTGSMRDELALGEHIEAVNCESVTFLSSDGTPVQAWLSVPRGPGPGPHPLIISMHGGPHMVAKSAFSPGALSFLDCGFAHMSLNYRGSITFGKDFRAKIVGNIGKWESEDVVAGRKWAINEGIAAQDKVLLVGSSYGGYLVLYCLAKHPDLWQGGVARNAIADWMMKYEDEMTSMKGITASMFAGVPEDKPDVYTCSSPLSCADQIEAPILVFQSRRDSRVPPRQMRAFEDRMRKLRKPFEIHWLDSGHLGSQGDVEESIRQQEMILNFCLDVIGDSASVV